MLCLSSGINGSIHEQVGGTKGRVIGQQGEAGLTGTEGEQVGQGEQRPAGLFSLPVGLVEAAGWGALCPGGAGHKVSTAETPRHSQLQTVLMVLGTAS